MKISRPWVVTAAVVLGSATAVAGATVNLHLLKPHGSSQEPIVLGMSLTNDSPDRETTTAPTAVEPTTSVAPPATASPTTTVPVTVVRTYAVGTAGTVTLAIRAGSLALESVVPGAGWTSVVEGEHPDEVKVSFRRPGDDEAQASFHATLRGGEIRAEIEPEEGEAPDD